MRYIKHISILLFTLCLLLCLIAPGFAYTGSEKDTGPDFQSLTWEQLVEQLLAYYSASPESVSFGYYNTVTGEEHYHNPDKFFVAASTYKVPLNMYFVDMIEEGSFTWESTVMGIPYEYVMKQSITFSDNNMASYLSNYLGGYSSFRELILPYMEPDPSNVDPDYNLNNNFTAREMVYCLKQLYSEPKYEKIIDAMKVATPNAYFSQDEDRYAVAQKYGYLVDNYKFYLNDAAIVYTNDPIILVMFSRNLTSVYQIISQYCILMCDYTQYHTTERIQAQNKAEALRLREPGQARGLLALGFDARPATDKEDSTMDISGIMLYIAIAFAAIAVITLLLIRSRKHKEAKPMGLIITIIVTALAICVCVIAVSAGTLIAKPDGDPRETVELFFNALEARDYISTYSCLSNYDSLGLENAPDTEAGKLAYQALCDSYAFEYNGECVIDKLDAVQPISFTYLDLTSLEGDVEKEVKLVLNSIVQSRPRNELYDENDRYLPAVTDEAYKTAVMNVLQNAGEYYTTVQLDVALTYKDSEWLIVMDDALLKALIGNTLH